VLAPPAASSIDPVSPPPDAPLRGSGNDLLTGPAPPVINPEEVARTALAEGIRRIASEVRNSLDYYMTAQGETPVTRALLCGAALDIPGFDTGLSRELGLPVERGEVALAGPDAGGNVPNSALAVAAGLSVPEGPA
jgi:Tfp pilus assembly PilM family ATPase